MYLVVSANPASPWAGTALTVQLAMPRGGPNTFINVTSLIGDLQFAAGDTVNGVVQ